jgi:hypothetical protein
MMTAHGVVTVAWKAGVRIHHPVPDTHPADPIGRHPASEIRDRAPQRFLVAGL